MEYQRDEHRVHLIVYHLLWCPKRRKPVLTGDVAGECQYLIRVKCAEHGWDVRELAVQPDHVHLVVRCRPADSAAYVVKECKGLTSRRLRQQFKHLLRLPSLWSRSFFASTAGNVSSATIQRYLAAQKGL
jgi:putative transposase